MQEKERYEPDVTLLVSYAQGWLSPEAMQKVTNALQADELLRMQYEGILQLIKNHPGEDPEEVLQSISQKIGSRIQPLKKTMTPVKKLSSLSSWMAAAAVIAIMATTSVIIYRQSHSATALASKMIEGINPSADFVRGEFMLNDTTHWKAEFLNSQFLSVISKLENKPDKTDEENFFLAISYIKTSPAQPEKAEPLFSAVVQRENDYTSDARLYLGLSQTLLHKNEQAIESLLNKDVEQTSQVKELENRLRK